MALAATVAHGVLTGREGADPRGDRRWERCSGSTPTGAPSRRRARLILAAVLVAVAGGLIRVNERHLLAPRSARTSSSRRRSGSSASTTRRELRRIAEVAADGAAAAPVGGHGRPGRPLRGRAAVARGRVGPCAVPLALRGSAGREPRVFGAIRGAPARAAARERPGQHAERPRRPASRSRCRSRPRCRHARARPAAGAPARCPTRSPGWGTGGRSTRPSPRSSPGPGGAARRWGW